MLKHWKRLILIPTMIAALTVMICSVAVPKTYLFHFSVLLGRIADPELQWVEYPGQDDFKEFLLPKEGRFAGNPGPALVYISPIPNGFDLEVEAKNDQAAEGYVDHLMAMVDDKYHVTSLAELSKKRMEQYRNDRRALEAALAKVKGHDSLEATRGRYELTTTQYFFDDQAFQERMSIFRPLVVKKTERSRSPHFPPMRALALSIFLLSAFVGYATLTLPRYDRIPA